MSVLSLLTTAGVTADRLFSGKSNYPWLGDIAELIVYTQPLTASQRKSVEDYLTLKYSPFVGTAGAPEFSPNGGAFAGSVEVALTTPDARGGHPLHDGREYSGCDLAALREPHRPDSHDDRPARAPSATV